ncbi:hypothetical protein [Aneurinibacillus soli]|nr:hypothetical protein [Aneurinibacillus soli]
MPADLKAEVVKQINENFDSKRAGAIGYISELPNVNAIKESKDSQK